MMQISFLSMRFENLLRALDEIGLTLIVFMGECLDEIIVACTLVSSRTLD